MLVTDICIFFYIATFTDTTSFGDYEVTHSKKKYGNLAKGEKFNFIYLPFFTLKYFKIFHRRGSFLNSTDSQVVHLI